LYIVVSAKLQG